MAKNNKFKSKRTIHSTWILITEKEKCHLVNRLGCTSGQMVAGLSLDYKCPCQPLHVSILVNDQEWTIPTLST